MEARKNERLVYIDVAKALAIFLVILGHCRMLPESVIQWIYAFHMPLFFILYGCTYNSESHMERGFCTRRFVLARLERLYIPCLIWAMIYSSFSFKNIILNIYASHTTFSMSSSLTSLWFLSCMFVTTIVFELVCMVASKFKHSIILEIVCCLFLFALGCILPQIKYGYPLCFNIALVAIAFIMTGHLGFQKLYRWLMKKEIWITVLITIGSGLLSIILFPMNLNFVNGENVEMATGDYGNIILFYITAVIASICILSISLLISKIGAHRILSFLTWVGANTLGIMILHKPIIQFIARVVNLSLEHQIVIVGIIGVCSSIIVCIICSVITSILKRYVPIFVGETKAISK